MVYKALTSFIANCILTPSPFINDTVYGTAVHHHDQKCNSEIYSVAMATWNKRRMPQWPVCSTSVHVHTRATHTRRGFRRYFLQKYTRIRTFARNG